MKKKCNCKGNQCCDICTKWYKGKNKDKTIKEAPKLTEKEIASFLLQEDF
jgi:hypothetical protein